MALTDAERQEVVDNIISGPKSVSVDGNSATAHDPTAIADLADRSAASTAVRRSAKRGLKFSQFSPGGAS